MKGKKEQETGGTVLWHPERIEVEISWANRPVKSGSQAFLPGQCVRLCGWVLIGTLRRISGPARRGLRAQFHCHYAYPLDHIEVTTESSLRALTHALTLAVEDQFPGVTVAPMQSDVLDLPIVEELGLSDLSRYRSTAQKQQAQARVVRYLRAQKYRRLTPKQAARVGAEIGTTGPEVRRALAYVRKQEAYLEDGNGHPNQRKAVPAAAG